MIKDWRWLLAWLPVVVLLMAAANHFWQVWRNQLSPWLGAGFGMFSTTDVGSARQVHLSVLLADGTEHRLQLGEPYLDTLERARALPIDDWLARLAEAVFQALDDEPEVGFPSLPLSLRIEIWRSSYQPGTLRPDAARLAVAVFPFERDAD